MSVLAAFFATVTAQASATPRAIDTIPPLPSSNVIIENWDGSDPPIRKNCAVPHPGTGERLILLGFYDGAALPDHSIVGADDVTETGAIRIGKGPGKIFLVVTSETPMIFRLTGHVERLSRVVVLNRVAAAVSGISATRVSFGIGRNCETGNDSSYVKKAVREIFGREPHASAINYQLFEWNLGASGAGSAVKAPHEYAGRTELEIDFGLYFPGGIVRIDPEELVSSQTAVRYEVLPSTAGAVQLERAGAIIRATDNEMSDWRAKARDRYGERVIRSLGFDKFYRVIRPIVLPAGLCGGHTINFLVPSPDFISGAPCHSDILTFDGQILNWAGHVKSDYPELEGHQG